MKHKNLASGIVILLISMVTCLMIACGDNDDFLATEPLQIKSFTISPEAGQVGDQFLFSWETTGAERVRIEPAISEQDLPSSGSMSVEEKHSTWYTLTADAGESEIFARAWVQVDYPEGSNWSYPRADTSNSAFSHWPGPPTGSLKWSFPFSRTPGDTRYITLAGDDSVRVSVHSYHRDGGYMIALNPDGSLKFGKYSPISQQVVSPSNITYGSGSDRKMFKAFNPDGSLKWEKNMGPNYANILRDREIYVNQQGNIFLYEMAHFQMEDRTRLLMLNDKGDIEYITNAAGGFFYNGFALNCDSTLVYASSAGYGAIYCLNDRFEKIWSTYLANFAGRPVTDQNCQIYCTFGDNYPTSTYGMISLDNQGQEIWRVYYPESTYPVERYGSVGGTIARSDNALYVLLNDTSTTGRNVLCAIDFGGTMLWTISLDGDDFSGEVVVDNDDCTYVSTSGHIYSFNSAGTLRWQVYYPDENFQSLTLSRNSTLYAAGERRLYAFGD